MASLLKSFNKEEINTLVRPASLGRDFKIADSFFERKLAEFCKSPVTGDITYTEEGKKTTKLIGDINQSFPYFNLLRNKNLVPTLFIHGIENIEKSLCETIYRMSPEQNWRFSNVSSSISSKDSSIGFHADTMDVIVVQIYGSRLWKFYKEENMDEAYVKALKKNIILPAPIQEKEADATYTLEPGDILHIPAYWGHEGVTTSDETSFSLSFSWCRFTPYIFLLQAFAENEKWESLLESEALYSSYIPDYLDKEELANFLMRLFQEKNVPVEMDTIVNSIEVVMEALTTGQKKPQL